MEEKMAFISIESGNIVVENVGEQKKVVEDIGGVWDAFRYAWTAVFTIRNLEYLIDNLKPVGVAVDVDKHVEAQQAKEIRLEQLKDMSNQNVPVRMKVPGLRGSMYNYQRLGVMYSTTGNGGLLNADEMGLGKTIQAIATALMLKHEGKASNALIITPASLKFNWPIEIDKFTSEKYVVIDGDGDERIAQWLRKDVFFYIVNYELLLEDLFGGRKMKPKRNETAEAKERRIRMILNADKRQRILGDVRRRVWDFIAIDEAQAIKGHDSKRSHNVKLLRAKFKMALTGTPMDGRLEELHSIMEFVRPGLLGTKTRFFQKYVETDFFGRVTGYKKIEEVKERIRPFFIRRLKRDVLDDLPDKIYENRMVVLSARERELYDSLADCGHEVTADADAIVAILRCKQFCNWPVMVDDTCKAASKMDSFREVIEEVVSMNGHKALVFSQYRLMVDVLVKVFDEMGLKYLRIDGKTPKLRRAEMQQEFNTDKSIDIMVGTDAMSAGLNFTAADFVVNYDDAWSPMIMSQREDRAHRIGQRNVVTVVNFICRDTVEERIRGVIYAKNRITAEVLGDETDEMILKRLGPRDMARLL